MDSKGSAGGRPGGPAAPPSAGARAGLDWLAEAAQDPDACRLEWHRGGAGLVLLPAGRRWDVLLVAGPLGRPALAALARHPGGPGPVYADFGGEHLGFLVPVGTAARWLGTGVRTAGAGAWIVVPHPAGRGSGVRWLVPPDGSGRLTDPALLEFALHEAAADLAHPCR